MIVLNVFGSIIYFGVQSYYGGQAVVVILNSLSPGFSNLRNTIPARLVVGGTYTKTQPANIPQFVHHDSSSDWISALLRLLRTLHLYTSMEDP